MPKVLVILEWENKREHIIMPKKVAMIYKKFIRINSKKSVLLGTEIYLKDINIRIFENVKIITAYKTIRALTQTSNFYITDLLFCCMMRNIHNNSLDENNKDIDIDLCESRIGHNTSKLSKQHSKFILKYKKEILHCVDCQYFFEQS